MGSTRSGGLWFLHSFTRTFRRERSDPRPAAARHRPHRHLEALRAQFEAAVHGLDERIQEHLAGSGSSGATLRFERDRAARRAAERAVARQRRLEEAHRAIRQDIEGLHARLRSGLEPQDLSHLALSLAEVDAFVEPGRHSLQMLPRARWTIAQKLVAEAGPMAIERLVALLREHGVAFPDLPPRDPFADAEARERFRRKRRAELRDAFLACRLKRTSERLLGVVSSWGSDYPERGSVLWQESVFEGVAAGLRAQLFEEFVDVLRRRRAEVEERVEAFLGSEVEALEDALRTRVGSLEQANQALAAALRVLDEVVPTIAWEQVRAELARPEDRETSQSSGRTGKRSK